VLERDRVAETYEAERHNIDVVNAICNRWTGSRPKERGLRLSLVALSASPFARASKGEAASQQFSV